MKKVIIIDDSIAQLNYLKMFFANNSWEVYSAPNAALGFQMIFDVAPDLIITDAIMPKFGGFQLLKQLRENEIISKIPVIVYSVLDNTNAKFYIREKLGEYYLQKTDNLLELLNLAKVVVEKHSIDEQAKSEILKTNLQILPQHPTSLSVDVKPVVEDIFKEELKIDEEELGRKLKEIYNFSSNDTRLFEDFFNILYPILKYDLFLINVYCFEEKQNKVFFDIKDIILSPIFQNSTLKKYGAVNSHLYKKYAPNLKMITNENEFNSKIEFNFMNQDIEVANIAFYSKDKNKYDAIELDALKNHLKNFFQARYVNKNSQMPKTASGNSKYLSRGINLPFLNIFDNSAVKNNIYLGIIQITNFSFLRDINSPEALDVLNLKISEKIINYLEANEQVYKNEDDEYIVMLLAKDNKQALNKFSYLLNELMLITDEDGNNVEIVIGVSSCVINNEFNVYEARKIAISALEDTNKKDRVVIK